MKKESEAIMAPDLDKVVSYFQKRLEYEKCVRKNLQMPVGINTPITEKNKDAVLKARQIAAKQTGYKPTNIFDQLKTYGEDVYGNARYSPYEFPVYILD